MDTASTVDGQATRRSDSTFVSSDVHRSLTRRSDGPALGPKKSNSAESHLKQAANFARLGDREAVQVLIQSALDLLRDEEDRQRELLKSFVGTPHASEQTPTCVRRARVIATFIESHLNEPLRVDRLSKLVGQSTSQFSRSFRRWFGSTLSGYIRTRRMEAAKRLMIGTTMSLCEIAAECGMADQAHFSREFRRLIGETPKRWRNSRAGMTSDFESP